MREEEEKEEEEGGTQSMDGSIRKIARDGRPLYLPGRTPAL
jgi:hypothetical protein